jgi:hypothetical protein
MPTIEARLAQLERAMQVTRRWTVAGWALAAALLIVALTREADAGPRPRRVRATALELVNENGQTRALFGPNEDGDFGLFLWDEKRRPLRGKLRLSLKLDALDGAGFYTSDAQAFKGFEAGTTAGGDSDVILWDFAGANLVGTAAIGVNSAGPHIQLFSPRLGHWTAIPQPASKMNQPLPLVAPRAYPADDE